MEEKENWIFSVIRRMNHDGGFGDGDGGDNDFVMMRRRCV